MSVNIFRRSILLLVLANTAAAMTTTAAAAAAPTQNPAPAAQARQHTLIGTFRTHPKFHSNTLPTDRDVIVYLPPGYDDPKNAQRRYPVLYLHDGQNVFDGATSFIPGPNGEWRADENAEKLIRAGLIEPLILVGVYNAGVERVNEYTLSRDVRRGVGGQAALYGRLLAEELKPFIDRAYRTKSDALNTGLCGSSLGGLATLSIGLDHPNVFGKLAVVSPSVWWDNLAIVRRVRAVTTQPPVRIWLDMGTKETKGTDGIDHARLLRKALVAKGWIEGADLKYVEAEGAEHNEQAWAARIGPILTFLFPKK